MPAKLWDTSWSKIKTAHTQTLLCTGSQSLDGTERLKAILGDKTRNRIPQAEEQITVITKAFGQKSMDDWPSSGSI